MHSVLAFSTRTSPISSLAFSTRPNPGSSEAFASGLMHAVDRLGGWARARASACVSLEANTSLDP